MAHQGLHATAQPELMGVTLSFRLPESEYNRLKKLADDDERTLAYHARKALVRYMDRIDKARKEASK